MLSVPAPTPYVPASVATTGWDAEKENSVVLNDTAWLLSFVDILTLLLTLFVLLLAFDRSERPRDELSLAVPPQQAPSAAVRVPMINTLRANFTLPRALNMTDWVSALDPYTMTRDEKLDMLLAAAADANAPSPAIGGTDALPSAVDTIAAQTTLISLLPDAEPLAIALLPDSHGKAGEALADAVSAVAPADAAASPTDPAQREASAAAASLLGSISDALRERVEVSLASGMVNLEISDKILFQPASATLTAAGYAALDELALALKNQPYVLSVEGHTDNVPIATALFPSNWELSSARAAIVTRGLIEHGIAADRIRAIGYGETRPRADNVSAEGRARNRRVAFVLHVE